MIDAMVVPKGLLHPTFGATIASILTFRANFRSKMRIALSS
jgi:hypothetical protein